MDISLYYQSYGNGFPLVLLHGNGGDSNYFAQQVPYFSRFRRVIALDTRGHGKSPRGTAPFSIRQFAEDLLHFLDEQNLPQVDLLGFSDGGNIALTFAAKYPHRIRRLVLNGANFHPSGIKTHIQLPIVLGYRTTALLAPKSSRVQQNAELLRLMVYEPLLRPVDLQRITVPTLVIAGTRDMVKTAHTVQLYRNLPDAQLQPFARGHFIASKTAEAFNQVVGEFLTQ